MGFSEKVVRFSSYYWNFTFSCFLENESECRTNAYYNECTREGDRKKGKPKISDTKEQKRTIIIDVKGAVSKEGVYEMKEGDRVKDAVQKAGGFLSEVDMKKVNLAQIVQDQMILYIPSKNESEQGVLTSSKEDGKIRINTAAKEQLEKITGIGSRKAESILKYREEHGPFQKIEDLLEIDGIGAKSLEKIKGQIIIP